MAKQITASMLYNFVKCPHRVDLDIYGNPNEKDQVSVFIQLLWEKGNAFECEVIESLKVLFTDLSPYSKEEKEKFTIEAMIRGDDLIYSGRIRAEELLGEPDLLRKHGKGYITGDIKSGAGEEGTSDSEDKKPKKHYAVQLALYTDILEKLGYSGGRIPFIWDIHGDEIYYDLDSALGKRNTTTLWEFYQDILGQIHSMISRNQNTLPAYSSICKLCHWRTLCNHVLKETNDLTLVPELGRVKRDVMVENIKDIYELANVDITSLIIGKKTIFPRIGPETLRKFQTRAKLQIRPDSKPLLKESLNLAKSDVEVFFDIETDPMRDICYLHGFVERKNRDKITEKYFSFFSDEPTPNEEEKAFAQAWKYIESVQPCIIYYYSKYERTIWRKLQTRYPHIATKEAIEDLFSPMNSIDLLYDVVKPKTEWPTTDYSIKTLASYLGFSWRDTDPSGASSIEWYHRWVENKDNKTKQRILNYNEDDCIATRVLLDGIRDLE